MKKRDVKSDIFKAVYTVAAEEGLENTTTKRISQAAKTTEAAIYYHFKNKEELFEESFTRINKDIDIALRGVGESLMLDMETDEEEKYIAIWSAYLNFWLTNPTRTLFYDSYIHSHYITTEIWFKQSASFVFFMQFFDKVMRNFYRAADMDGTVFVWMMVINTALMMAKGAIKSDKPVSDKIRQLVVKILKIFMDLQHE